MAKITDYAKLLHKYLNEFLTEQQGSSVRTTESYAYSLKLFSRYLDEISGNVDKVTMLSITKETVLDFLETVGVKRKWKAQTRNLRLSAIKAFFYFSANENEKYRFRSLQIGSIPVKKSIKVLPAYLSQDGLKTLLQQPNLKTFRGLRHFTILSLLYDSGARVTELIDLTPTSLRQFNGSTKLRILGKGNKEREVSLTKAQMSHLRQYMQETGLNDPKNDCRPLFFNSRGEKLTKEGVAHILKKYVAAARSTDKTIPEDLHCHSIRHTKAIHLLESGWSILDIMRFLGHEGPETTMRYLQFNNSKKDQALHQRTEKLMSGILPSQLPAQREKRDIIRFLNSKT